MKKVFVVGDKFSKFLNHENTISISNFEKQLFRNTIPKEGVAYHLGQGVAMERANRISHDAVELKGLGVNIAFEAIRKSSRHLVHKHNCANSMLSVPRRVSEHLYEADVHIDDRCSDLDDHITGQHVSGMVLVEACRQMFLAVTEQYYLKAYEREFYFVIKKSSMEYRRFVFPLDIKLNYRILSHKTHKPGVLAFDIECRVIQCGRVCAQACYEFIAYDADHIEQKEDTAARELIMAQTKLPEVAING
ncbi:AfsA-related hotdog domain-containing protein [Ketobacter alkanivorans]|uniref:A-factor biosynthesis hotdog domain-containing protein n=1 Tax=Ketobacter alkanivorans TaxID=1917421 RepID=A0A2K9LKS7_9GAMM|nr:AfsA-related hotdog domain-containing protein [Ketobacter alkanivorans]AUM12863.1 hypothetical protein Kalk_10710 [Ketobacter alkanivorans]